MRDYLGKDSWTANEEMAVVHELVGQLSRRFEGVRCKLFADNYFSSYVSVYISTLKVNCCGTVCQNSTGMAHDFGHKLVQVNCSDMPEMRKIYYIGMEQQMTD
jgi:hypothetical protein